MKPYFEDKGITLYCGDALEVLPTIESCGVTLLDPPYSMVPNSFAGKDDGAAGTSGAPVRLLNESLVHTRRLLPEGGVAALICDWRRVPDVSYLCALNGLRLSTCIAWTRSSAGMGAMFRSSWDPILVLSVGSPRCKDRAAVKNTVHANHSDKQHPYEKPIALWRHVLDRVEPTLVVDPFAGCGSSMIAARQAGHQWLGVEISEEYCERTVSRLQQEALNFEAVA